MALKESGSSQLPKLNRRTFIKGLMGAGVAIAIPGCGAQSSETHPTTPTTPTIPTSSTTETLPTTTVETTTTLPERVFASPEHRAQVEKIEENMAKFYNLTPDDLTAYQDVATFSPYPGGFSTLWQQKVNSMVLAVNLGVMPISFGSEGSGNLQFYGCLDESGNSYVTSGIASIPDSEYTTLYPNWQLDSKFAVNVYDPIKSPNVYRADQSGQGNLSQKVIGAETSQYLNTTIGQPILIEAFDFDESYGAGIVPNETLISTMKDIHSSALKGRRVLTSALAQYSDEQLAALGVFKNPGSESRVLLPQSLIDGFPGGFRQAFATLSVALTSTMFTNAPPLL